MTTTGQSGGGIAPRLLIIGLDGATFDVLRPLMAKGRMPHIRAAVEGGASGILHSTIPPITPAAWTTFLTGRSPGGHGVIDFERYDLGSHKLVFNNADRLARVRNIWRILGDTGRRVGSINVPLTYPARKVNGFLISGFDTPDTAGDFVYPPDLREELLGRWPDPTLGTNWRRSAVGGDDLFAENLDYMSKSFHQGAAMTRWCGERFGWDVLMVVLKLVDNLQHKTWKYIDDRWRDRDPKRTDMVEDCFAEADAAVGDLMAYARSNDAWVLIVSDHGHGSLEGKIQPNLLLKEWGYLHIAGGGAQAATRVRHQVDKWMGKTAKFVRAGDVLHDIAVDFDRTRACVMHAGMAGFLYLNLEGRQPCGIVKPEEYEGLRDELMARFLAEEAVDPEGRRIKVFRDVHKPEEIYGCSREDQPWMPDLMLMPHRPLAVVRKIRGNEPVRWLSYRKIEGTHRPEGIVIANGPGVRSGATIEMQMADCAPTVLAAMGCPLPDDLDGRVCESMFESPLEVRFERATGADVSSADQVAGDEESYSEAELAKITERLSDLGYLE